MRGGEAKGGGEEGERMLFHRRKTTRKSHFSQCINLPRNGEEGRMEERRGTKGVGWGGGCRGG